VRPRPWRVDVGDHTGDPRDQNLSDRRVSAIRDALIQAGGPTPKIQTGAFGDTRLTRDRRVEV
jgi:outer membrane protein OmpA-like peptidoglycan-associated protein